MKSTEHPYLQSSGFATDLMIGMSDGIILPFALAAVLSFVVQDSSIVLAAGVLESLLLAAVFGIATYQTVVNQAEEYPDDSGRVTAKKNFVSHLQLQQILSGLEMEPEILKKAAEEGEHYKTRWTSLLSGMGLGLAEPDYARAKKNAWNVALAFLLGACLPLLPFCFASPSLLAFKYSAVITVISLFIFGWAKAAYTGQSPWKVIVRLMTTVIIVAGAALLVAWMFGS